MADCADHLIFRQQNGLYNEGGDNMSNIDFLNDIIIPKLEKWVNAEVERRGYVMGEEVTKKLQELLDITDILNDEG